MEVYGNTTGLSTSERKALERIYRRRVPFDVLTTPELSRSLCEISHTTGRQVGALVHRSGQVEYVIVGDATKLMLPDIGRLRGSLGRFRGLRLVHTHLRHEGLSRDDLVDLTRLRLDMVAALCLAPNGHPGNVHYAHCIPVAPGSKDDPFRVYGPTPYGRLSCNPQQVITSLEEEFARAARTRPVTAKDGRALLVHVHEKQPTQPRGNQSHRSHDQRNHDQHNHDHRSHDHPPVPHAAAWGQKSPQQAAQESLRELSELARTAGVEVADSIVQVRDKVDPKYVLGRGRLEDTVLQAMQLDVEVLIFDRDLTPAQSTAIAGLTDLKVLDRTQLILDIFAQRAEGGDGRLQVELAQMRYLLPRLGTKDDALSRLTGGIGGRGPGETKLEVGKRRARERITQLESRLKQLARQREQRRARRTRREIPVVAVVGYTNAGKSTLLNALTKSAVLVEDKLFATLDTRSRRIRFPQEREVVITDTVGFIRDLPKTLFSAFRATFEEASDADLLLHVIDASDPAYESHIETTESLLVDLNLDQLPRLVVFNKTDLLAPATAAAIAARRNGVTISAMQPDTLHGLLERMEHALFAQPEAVWAYEPAGSSGEADRIDGGQVVGHRLPMVATVFADVEVASGATEGE